MSVNLPLTQRPYCFALPERSLKNHQDAPADWCDSCDHFEACQEAHKHRPRILTLHLKEQYFRQIAEGTKIEEYREATDYWRQRLEGKTFDVIEICNRYPERGDIDNRLWFRWSCCRLSLMKWDNEGIPVSGQTFVIPLQGRLEYPYQAVEVAHCPDRREDDYHVFDCAHPKAEPPLWICEYRRQNNLCPRGYA